jgi:copper chaperone CopZ
MRTRLRILGMSTPHCIRAVFTALTPVEGIISAEVVLGGAEIEHDGRATGAALIDAIAVAGYEAVVVVEERRRLPVTVVNNDG